MTVRPGERASSARSPSGPPSPPEQMALSGSTSLPEQMLLPGSTSLPGSALLSRIDVTIRPDVTIRTDAAAGAMSPPT